MRIFVELPPLLPGGQIIPANAFGHNLPQEAPEAFTQAVLDAGGL